MTDPRQAMQMALEALRCAHEQVEIAASNADWAAFDRASDDFDDALDALRAAPSAQQEPVAWLVSLTHPDWLDIGRKDDPGAFPVYTHPAPTVQPLTDEQIDKIAYKAVPVAAYMGMADHAKMPKELADRSMRNFARAIERAHGIGGA